MRKYTGSCHCGRVRFEIEADITKVTQCNCSVCHKKGILHHRVAPGQFRLLCPESEVATYQFGTRTARHHFCPHCGIHVYTRPRAAPEQYTVNVRVLDDFDLEAEKPEVVHFNGREWEANVQQLKT
jgi:hypothetical protein